MRTHEPQMHDVSLGEDERGLKTLYAAFFVFYTSIAMIKSSALFFYSRIFGQVSRRFNVALLATHIALVAWLIFALGTATFHCTPAARFWDKSMKGSCQDGNGALYIAVAALDTALDLIVLFLPMPVIYQLHMSKSKKTLVLGAFLCGYW